jgi:hypothetical protein
VPYDRSAAVGADRHLYRRHRDGDCSRGWRHVARRSAGNMWRWRADHRHPMDHYRRQRKRDPKCVLHNFNTTMYTPWLLNRDMMVTEHDVLLIYR